MITVKTSTRKARGWTTPVSSEMTIEQAAEIKRFTAIKGQTYVERFNNTKKGETIAVAIYGTLTELAEIARLSETAVYIGGELFCDYSEK